MDTQPSQTEPEISPLPATPKAPEPKRSKASLLNRITGYSFSCSSR